MMEQGYKVSSIVVYRRGSKSLLPNANFVHCAAHNLNLVLNDSSNLPEVTQFYDTFKRHMFSSGKVYYNSKNCTNQVLQEDGGMKKKLILKNICFP